MAGKPGHGGRRPLDIADHLARGTFRADRHAAALAKAVEPPEAADVTDAQRRAVLRGLGRDGRAYVSAALAEFSGWTSATLPLLRRAGHSYDRLAALEQTIATDGGAVVVTKRGVARPHPLLAVVRAETRGLLAIVRALDLREN